MSRLKITFSEAKEFCLDKKYFYSYIDSEDKTLLVNIEEVTGYLLFERDGKNNFYYFGDSVIICWGNYEDHFLALIQEEGFDGKTYLLIVDEDLSLKTLVLEYYDSEKQQISEREGYFFFEEKGYQVLFYYDTDRVIKYIGNFKTADIIDVVKNKDGTIEVSYKNTVKIVPKSE